MLSRLCGLCLTVAALVGLPLSASGQQPDTTQLPEIAPREIEIRGERQVALPSLERQPLSGFTSPPTVPSVPSDHRPYRGAYEPSIDGLPEQLPVSESVSASLPSAPDPARGFLEGGSGRYFGRFFEGRLGAPLSPDTRLSLHGAYTGTEADPNDDVASARVRLSHTADPIRLEGALHGMAQRYALYGAAPLPLSAPDTPDREGYSAGGRVELRRAGNRLPARAEVRYDHTQYTSLLDAGGGELTYEQQQLTLDGAATVPLPYRPHLAVQYRRSWLGGASQDAIAYDLSTHGTVSFSPAAQVSVEAGVALLAYDTPARPAGRSPGSVEALRFAPVVDAEWRISDGTRLHLRNRPRLGDTSLDRLYQTNPYAQHAPSLRPSLETTNAEAGLTLSRGLVRVVVAGGYRYAPSYRYFTLGTQADYAGLYRVGYDAARIYHGRGEVALQGVNGIQASLGFSVRDGALPDLDQPIPNFAPVTADAMVAVSFAEGDGFLKAHGEFRSPRDAGLAQNTRTDAYFSVDLEASYALGADFELVARADHLSFEDPVRWANYPQPAAEVSLGLRLRW